eukprot:CAMPEP_0174841802 /NCGR_PEP_ID=MMETSP1114-20130205/9549_1 /TAXON_ID=312471 /ORGANISM="Neobodo designis, Strain CCAP 1951/1" /LENGTH=61 /DNA_ID=CAMNT_0016075999 /DNA_START=28 /DNA_END=213 /DNA_ORIENTATION=-
MVAFFKIGTYTASISAIITAPSSSEESRHSCAFVARNDSTLFLPLSSAQFKHTLKVQSGHT